jgi:hypothetical protein
MVIYQALFNVFANTHLHSLMILFPLIVLTAGMGGFDPRNVAMYAL